MARELPAVVAARMAHEWAPGGRALTVAFVDGPSSAVGRRIVGSRLRRSAAGRVPGSAVAADSGDAVGRWLAALQ